MQEHISKYKETYGTFKRWAVCGKGPSLADWEPSLFDQTASVNDAIHHTKQGIFTCYDLVKEFRFCHEDDLHESVIPIIPPRVCKNYMHREAYYYQWPDIGLKGGNCTGVQSICIACSLGAEEITLYGFEGVETGNISYHEPTMNPNNRKSILRCQVPQFCCIPEAWQSRCRFFGSGARLDEVLRARVAEKGANLSM